jgi:dCMP deaminase
MMEVNEIKEKVKEMSLKEKVEKYDRLYMDIAKRVSEMSHDTDTKVGAVIVKDGNIISMGWNGTPKGFPNHCKDTTTGATLPIVIHAEANAICKLARSSTDGEGATIYTTLSPCIECTKLIMQSGITDVVVGQLYEKDLAGYTILKNKKMIKLLAKDK